MIYQLHQTSLHQIRFNLRYLLPLHQQDQLQLHTYSSLNAEQIYLSDLEAMVDNVGLFPESILDF